MGITDVRIEVAPYKLIEHAASINKNTNMLKSFERYNKAHVIVPPAKNNAPSFASLCTNFVISILAAITPKKLKKGISNTEPIVDCKFSLKVSNSMVGPHKLIPSLTKPKGIPDSATK